MTRKNKHLELHETYRTTRPNMNLYKVLFFIFILY